MTRSKNPPKPPKTIKNVNPNTNPVPYALHSEPIGKAIIYALAIANDKGEPAEYMTCPFRQLKFVPKQQSVLNVPEPASKGPMVEQQEPTCDSKCPAFTMELNTKTNICRVKLNCFPTARIFDFNVAPQPEPQTQPV